MEQTIQIQYIKTEAIAENPANPRKIFRGIGELAEDLKKRGMLEPVLVRLIDGNGTYELIFGARRLRAARMAELPQIPAMVREMADEEVLETMIVENVKRDDMHALEEAAGYGALIERYNWDVPSIAAKVGKSITSVYQRLKLLELIEPVKKAFMEDKITAGHAILLARLQPKDQAEVFKEGCFNQWEKELRSVKYLADWIDSNIHLDLNSASFKKGDAELLPEAGPCTTCPKRTGFIPELFPDIKRKDTCTDRTCFDRKIEAFTERWMAEKSQGSPLRLSTEYDYRAKKAESGAVLKSNQYRQIMGKKDGCKSIQEGIVVEGHDRGKVMKVCADFNCKVHWSGAGKYIPPAEEVARKKAEKEKARIELMTRERVLNAMMTKEPLFLDEETMRFIARESCQRLFFDYRKKVVDRHGFEPVKLQYGKDYDAPMLKHIKTCSTQELDRFLIEIALAPHVWGNDGKNLVELARHHGIDVKAIENEVKKERQTKIKPKTDKAKTKAKAKAKVHEVGVCRGCGCTQEHACEGAFSWSDESKTLCTSCVPADPATGNCADCSFQKRVGNKKIGVKIPNASGKCTRPEGLCF